MLEIYLSISTAQPSRWVCTHSGDRCCFVPRVVTRTETCSDGGGQGGDFGLICLAFLSLPFPYLEGRGVGADRDRTGIARGVERNRIVWGVMRPVGISKTYIWREHGRQYTTRVIRSICFFGKGIDGVVPVDKIWGNPWENWKWSWHRDNRREISA